MQSSEKEKDMRTNWSEMSLRPKLLISHNSDALEQSLLIKKDECNDKNYTSI